MNEASKFRERAQREGWFDRYFKGRGLDVGCGTDLISPNAYPWDVDQGDAQYLDTLQSDVYDWVFSSHCLEHMKNPQEALLHWWRVLKPGGYLIVLTPDEDLYEQGVWPSKWNPDHKSSFTPSKTVSWCVASRNLVDLISNLPGHKLISLRIVDTGYDYSKTLDDQYKRGLATWLFDDQTQSGAELAIEFIVQKAPYQPRGFILPDAPTTT